MMMKDSADEIIRKAYPEIKSGTKWLAGLGPAWRWNAAYASDIIRSKKVSSKVGPKGKRDMVSEEIRMFKEEQRKAVLLLRPNNVLGQNEMISNQLNYRGNPEWQWNHGRYHSFFALIMIPYRMGPT